MWLYKNIHSTISLWYVLTKMSIRRKLGMKNLADDPIKCAWRIHRMRGGRPVDKSKLLSTEEIDEALNKL